MVDISASDYQIQLDNYSKFTIEWHRKFTLSFACLLLFLIGAPLGAIIRKGGLGMPLIVAIILFLLYHIISITGEKLSKTNAVESWVGMWMASAFLLPIAVVLVNAARKDSQVFNKELYNRFWNNFRKIFVKV
jgi:lipopolysaccharide export system permease protein